jgi:hypothetical protein
MHRKCEQSSELWHSCVVVSAYLVCGSGSACVIPRAIFTILPPTHVLYADFYSMYVDIES